MTNTSFGEPIVVCRGCFLYAFFGGKKMKDRTQPCIYYVCKDADCKKGLVKVDLKKCKNCPKYKPRKATKRPESVKNKRQKDKDRHDNWKE